MDIRVTLILNMSSKSDASTKILGFKYQEMVALKECFEAKDGTKIYMHIRY
jgi:hypothetical protein